MGLSKKGKSCMDRSALVAPAISENTTHAWPRSRYVFKHTTSIILPNCENMAYRHFFRSAHTTTSVQLQLFDGTQCRESQSRHDTDHMSYCSLDVDSSAIGELRAAACLLASKACPGHACPAHLPSSPSHIGCEHILFRLEARPPLQRSRTVSLISQV